MGISLPAIAGGAIKGNHIDVFIGTHQESSFFPWIENNIEKSFQAFIVHDEKIIEKLTKLHFNSSLEN